MNTLADTNCFRRMRVLLKGLSDPQNDLKFVHVAGTNGKGSTCTMIANALQEAGYNVGLYTSPYLQIFNERIRVKGKAISDEDLSEAFSLIDEVASHMEEKPSEFERVTAAGFLYFKKKKCDIVVLEVGIGGLRDSTNIIETTVLSVICSIGFDHTDRLGNTIEEIAYHKAGISRKGIDTVVVEQDERILSVIRDVCRENGSNFILAPNKKAEIKEFSLEGQSFYLPSFGDVRLSVLGKNQVENASLAIEALIHLRKKGFNISDENIRKAMENTLWPGRFEPLLKDPYLILDCGHNPHGIKSLIENVKTYFPGKKPVILTGVMADKDYNSLYEELNEIAESYVAVNCDYERALLSYKLKDFLSKFKKPVSSYENMAEGVKKALEEAKEKDTFVLATGSVYICGDIRNILTGEHEAPVMKNNN